MCNFEDFKGSHCSTGGVIYTLGTSDLGSHSCCQGVTDASDTVTKGGVAGAARSGAAIDQRPSLTYSLIVDSGGI